jgi:glycosyltransferase involved in cell wall biosynthesis
MAAVYNALDILASCSVSEGFSNVIAEAMACGLPCVVTDVGDSAMIVGSPSQVVSPGRPEELKAAWTRLLELSPGPRARIAQSARERIVREYSVRKLVQRTELAFSQVMRCRN